MNMKGFLRNAYFTPLGTIASKLLVPVIRRLKTPLMLWGYKNCDGEWRSRTRISDTVFFYHRERINIANDVFVWHYTILDGTGGLEIGEGSQIGAWVGVFTHSSHVAIRVYGAKYGDIPEDKKIGFSISRVKIGRYVFVGAGSKIFPGVAIGDGALVAAGAVVSKNVEPFQIVSGNPAKVIGDTKKLDERYLAKNPELREWYEDWHSSTIDNSPNVN